MIKIAPEAEECVARCRALSEKRGLNFEAMLTYLDKYAGREKTVCEIYPDWPFDKDGLNLVFTMFRKKGDQNERWFNGGLIYYGPGDNGVNGPQFSVRIGDTSKEEWTVNT